MATENTGGWQLTTATYALGGRMEQVGSDGKVTATLDNPATKSVLERLKAMRWQDKSMGSTFDYAWGTMNQAFAAGQVGMFTGGSDLYTWMIQNAALKPDDYGITVIPVRRYLELIGYKLPRSATGASAVSDQSFQAPQRKQPAAEEKQPMEKKEEKEKDKGM